MKASFSPVFPLKDESGGGVFQVDCISDAEAAAPISGAKVRPLVPVLMKHI